MEELLALGRQNAGDTLEPFNMAYLAMRGSGRINGVSKLHGQVSRQIFSPLFPRWPEPEVPVGSVTNGVHVPTWDSAVADALWTAACGQRRWSGEEVCADKIRQLSDEQLWQLRNSARKNLIDRVRVRYARQRASGYDGPHDLPQLLDEHVLTVGFARRFATYKRPNFLLHDTERLIRLLTNPERPMQLILAGKAHPADKPGQALIKQWNDFIQRPGMAQHVVFLSDYDMLMAQELVQGADLWINTPRRPWEACGTSGMKTLVNGGLNFSELDGWWAEAYSPQVGWAIGDGLEHGDDPAWDSIEAEAMYSLLEQEVVPEFYERSENGMPSKWLSRVRESMARLTPEFSASRAIQNYTEEHYLPAASGYRQRAANNSALGAEVLQWLHKIAQGWNTVHFGPMQAETREEKHCFRVQVWPGDLSSCDLNVELYADPHGEHGAEIVTMTAGEKSADAKGSAIYSVDTSATRAASDYTPRLVPHHPSVAVPLEAGEILWER
jgi:starch phosphorylase